MNADVEAVADVTSLTQDDLQLVFESLPFAEDKSRAMRVCADWRTAASAPYLWTSLVVQDGRKLCAADVHRLLALCNGRLARLELQKAPFLASSLQLLSDNPRLLHLDLTGCKKRGGYKAAHGLKALLVSPQPLRGWVQAWPGPCCAAVVLQQPTCRRGPRRQRL